MKRLDLQKLSRMSAAELREQIDLKRLPAHVAVIMDGNGRWAKKRMLPRVAGHRAGVKSVREAVTTCAELGIQALTLYTFSTENWKRPEKEVKTLMNLLVEFLNKETATMMDNGVRLRAIGRIGEMSAEVIEALKQAEETTSQNPGLILNLALNYSGRSELVDAFRAMAGMVQEGNLQPSEINGELIATHLHTAGLPEPDLLIRTSGEMRLSNFLLWQLAYTEIHIADLYWPEFRKKHLYLAIIDYQSRQRRFGDVR